MLFYLIIYKNKNIILYTKYFLNKILFVTILYIKIFYIDLIMSNENIDVLKQRLAKAVEVFNEQKQTITDLEQQVKDLQFQLSETNKTFDKLVNEYKTLKDENLSLESQVNLITVENEKLVKRIEELKLELGKLSKDPFVNTAASARNKHKENNQNISVATYNKRMGDEHVQNISFTI